MMIDVDYVRQLLLEIDKELDTKMCSDMCREDELDQKKMRIHLDYMASKNLIEIDVEKEMAGIPTKVYVRHISALGRDYLDAIRDDDDFEKYKKGENPRPAMIARLLGLFAGSAYGGFVSTQ